MNFDSNPSGKEKGREPEGCGQKEINMLNVLERESDGKVQPEFSDRELKASRDYLSRKIARAEASGQPFAEVVTIDPVLAHLLLQRNPADENRKLSQSTVDKYAADMAGGRWQGLNGQTIVISSDGYLNDGQHRLNAIIECGGSIPFTIVFGAERSSRLTIDQNRVRTSGDYLGMSGFKNPNNVAAIASILHSYKTDNLSTAKLGGHKILKNTDKRPTKAFMHAFALKNIKDIERGFDVINDQSCRRVATPSRLAAALILIARKANWEDAEKFVQSVITGDELGKTNPAYVARERLISERFAGAVPPARTLEIMFRAWNAHRRGDRMTKMSLRGELPTIEG